MARMAKCPGPKWLLPLTDDGFSKGNHHLRVLVKVLLVVLRSAALASPRIFFQRRQWHPTLVLLPGKSHGWRSLVGCSPWGLKESDTTEQLHFHFSCIGEGNGNPLQCSCLENSRNGGAWWAAVYGVAQSRTRLKRLSSSRSFFEMKILKPYSRSTNAEVLGIWANNLCFNESSR